MGVEPDGQGSGQLQEWLAAQNRADPPTYSPPWFSGRYRHMCEEARQAQAIGRPVSRAIDLKERYVTLRDADIEDRDDLALVYREGRCKDCGQTARSAEGFVVRTADRPPLEGRVSR